MQDLPLTPGEALQLPVCGDAGGTAVPLWQISPHTEPNLTTDLVAPPGWQSLIESNMQPGATNYLETNRNASSCIYDAPGGHRNQFVQAANTPLIGLLYHPHQQLYGPISGGENSARRSNQVLSMTVACQNSSTISVEEDQLGYAVGPWNL